MRAMVTGGAGFIGSHSVEALLAAGAEVVVFDNFSSGKRGNLPEHASLRVVEGDIRDRGAVAAAVRGCTHILHLAAQVSVRASIEDPPRSAQTNIIGFAEVLDGARHHHVERVVFASSAAVYGDPQTLPLSEESRTDPLSPYGLEKLVNEQQAALSARLFGLSTLGLRYFNIYGPRQDPASQYAGVISRFADRIISNQPLTVFGDGKQTRDFVFVKDVAQVNLAALRGASNGFCNIGTGHTTSLLELIDTLAECVGHPAQIVFEAAQPGDIRHSAMTPARMREWFGAFEPTRLATGLRVLLGSVRS